MGDRVRLAITLGDPRGIGPEVAAAAVARVRESDPRIEPVFVGPSGTAADRAGAELIAVGDWNVDDAARAGALAGAAIERGVALATEGAVDGLVTAPIDKAALHAGGYRFPGHTEMLQSLTGAPAVAMLMTAERTRLGGPLRVVLVTTHIRLADVAAALDADRFVEQGLLTADALRGRWGIREPRLALCAVNPHASDGGLFGDEEERILAPARERLAEAGVRTAGPIPADTVFVRALDGEFDAVLCPYHDVGMAAFKTASFGAGVNVTLGLPFVRTSPDHGTALDIAGRGLADPGSMIEALALAARLTGSTTTVRDV